MFEQSFVEGTGKTRKGLSVFFTFVGELVVVGILILIPLIYTDTLPRRAVDDLPVGAAAAPAASSASSGGPESGQGRAQAIRRRPFDGAQRDPQKYRDHS